MASYAQVNRVLEVMTPLGRDALLLEKLSGEEAISELFCFRLLLLATQPVDFGKVLNQWATVRIRLPNGSDRYVNGIISRLTQGGLVAAGDGRGTFIRYRAELVPALWRLRKRVRSRIFQNQSVPEILKGVLAGDWRLDLSLSLSGKYEPRNYCVQYAESDFAFVSRLMEEEGIAYYFTHAADDKHEHDKHVLVLTDHPAGFGAVPGVESISYQADRGSLQDRPRIWEWEKSQEVTSSLHSLSDYHFEVPGSRLKASATVGDTVDVGRARHPLRFSHLINAKETLEVFEFPAGVAHRFDDVDGNGQVRGKEIEKLHDDGRRTARLRAEEAAAWSVHCAGAGSCASFLPGHLFMLAHHFDADASYLITRIEHQASCEGTYGSGAGSDQTTYENTFAAIPAALPFRPRRVTPKPRIDGVQTATVTGPKGSPIHVDLYGRVKLKFHWDRDGADDASSSCWVRTSQPWAGPRYGAFFWPRPGHEVVVAFECGDPDRPLVTGSVYNDDNMPPFGLPGNQNMTGIKSASLGGNPMQESNWLVFHDESGHEHFHLHSETHEVITSGTSKRHYSPGHEINIVGHNPLTALMGSGGGGGTGPVAPRPATGRAARPTLESASLLGAAFPPPGAGAGGGILDGLAVAAAITGEHPWPAFAELFPAAANFRAGSCMNGTLLGDVANHLLGGTIVNLTVDPGGMMMERLPTVLRGLGTAVAGLSGANIFNFGPNVLATYVGPSLFVDHSECVKVFGPETPAVKALALSAVLSAFATDIAGRIFSLQDAAADAEAKKQDARARIAEQKRSDAHDRRVSAAAKKEAAARDAQKAQADLDAAKTPEEKAAAKRRLDKAKQKETAQQQAEAAAASEEASADAEAAAARSAQATAKKEDEGPAKYVAWAGLASRLFVSRLLGFLNLAEELGSRAQTVKSKTDEAARLTRVIPLLTPMQAPPVIAAANNGVQQVAGLAARAAGVPPLLDTHDLDEHRGDWTAAAANVAIHAKGGLLPDSANLTLVAEGSTMVLGTKDVTVSRSARNFLQLADDKTSLHSCDIELRNVFLTPVMAPRIHVGSNKIALEVGAPPPPVGPPPPSITPRIIIGMNPPSIKLAVGPDGAGACIELTATGVTIYFGPSTITLGPTGISLGFVTSTIDINAREVRVAGLKTNLQAELIAAYRAISIESQATAMAKIMEVLCKIGN